MGIDSSRTTRVRRIFFFFFFQSASNAPKYKGSCYTRRGFEVEIEMRGDSVSVFRMEVTRGKEDAAANYRMIIN